MAQKQGCSILSGRITPGTVFHLKYYILKAATVKSFFVAGLTIGAAEVPTSASVEAAANGGGSGDNGGSIGSGCGGSASGSGAADAATTSGSDSNSSLMLLLESD